jgi:hypothetical protein
MSAVKRAFIRRGKLPPRVRLKAATVTDEDQRKLMRIGRYAKMRAAIITMKSISLMALLTVAFAAHAQSPKPDVADVLKAISEQLKPLFVSEHNLAETRDGFWPQRH